MLPHNLSRRLALIILLLTSFFLSFSQSVDDTFNANLQNFGLYDGKVVAVQPDGKIMIVTEYPTIYGIDRARLARLNPDGTLDQTFDANSTLRSDDWLSGVAIQEDGKILVAGDFARGSGDSKIYHTVLRFNPDGSKDITFQTNYPDVRFVSETIIQPDGKILMSYRDDYLYGVLRLHENGTIDETFNCPLRTEQIIKDIELQDDGKVIVAGGSISTSTQCLLKRYNDDGSLDASFAPVVTGTVYAGIDRVEATPSGGIFIGGYFTHCSGIARNSVAILDQDGLLDTDFVPGYNSAIQFFDVMFVDDEKMFITGYFGIVHNGENISVRCLVLNTDGSINNPLVDFGRITADDSFPATQLVPYINGKFFVCGGSSMVLNGVSVGYIALVNDDYSINNSFSIGPGTERASLVFALAVQDDGKILVGGNFHYADGESRKNIARLLADGALDESFDPGTGISGSVYQIVIQPDGKILIAGNFNYFNRQLIKNLVRLNTDGSLDETFEADESDAELSYSIALQNDGKIIVKSRTPGHNTRIRRYNADGSIDLELPHPSFWMLDRGTLIHQSQLTSLIPVAVQPDGKIITENIRYTTTGAFDTEFNPVAESFFVALAPDNKLIMRGGNYGSTYQGLNGLHRIYEDGTLDIIFDSEIQHELVTSVFIQPDGKTVVSSRDYTGLRRLKANGVIDSGFNTSLPIPSARTAILSPAYNLILVNGYTDFPSPFLAGPLLRLNINFKSSQSVNFAIEDITFNEPNVTKTLRARASSALPVTYTVLEGNASVSGNKLTINGTGRISVKAQQPGNHVYTSAETQVIFYAKRTQQIDIAKIGNMVFEDEPVEHSVQASASSGLPVEYVVTSGNALIEGTTIHILAPGEISFKIIQNGNDHYFDAEAVHSFDVKRLQTITFNEVGEQVFSTDLEVQLGATCNSGLPVSYQVVSGSASINGSQLVITDSGPITVKAIQSGNIEFFAAEAVQTFSAKRMQSISFSEPVDGVFEGTFIMQSPAEASSGLPVSLEIISGSAHLENNEIVIDGPGIVELKAMQAGNDHYLPVEETQSYQFRIRQELSFPEIEDMVFIDNLTVKLDAAVSSGLPVTYELLAGDAGLFSDLLIVNGPGLISVKALHEGNDTLLPIAVTQNFSVRMSQVLTFAMQDTYTFFEGQHIELAATSDALLPVTYTLVNGAGEINDGVLIIYGPGEFTVTAAQPGDDMYLAAEVSVSFCVNPARPMISVQDGLLLSTNAENFQWFIGDTEIEGAITQVLEISEAGSYSVQTSAGGCHSLISESTLITGTNEDPSRSGFHFYPNPVMDVMSIEISHPQKKMNIFIRLFNSTGQLISSQRFQLPASGVITFDTSELMSGLYLLEVQQAEGVFTRTLIVN